MKARTCSVHTVLVLVGHARLVVLRPPAAALALAGVLLVHALLLLDPVVVLVEVEASEVVRVHVVRVGVQQQVAIERRAAAVRRDHRHVLQHVVHHLLDLLHLVSHELPWSKGRAPSDQHGRSRSCFLACSDGRQVDQASDETAGSGSASKCSVAVRSVKRTAALS